MTWPAGLACSGKIGEYPTSPVLPLSMGGWCGPENERALLAAIQLVNPKVVVEIGVWQGLSTAYLAQHTAEDCTIYAVDHFLGGPDHAYGTPWYDYVPCLYEQFLSNMMHLGLTKKVVPVPLSSADAAVELDVHPDLLYVDGSHEELDVWHDITVWGAKVRPGGIVVGDDWNFPGVHAAVTRAQRELHVNLWTDGRVWSYRKPEA